MTASYFIISLLIKREFLGSPNPYELASPFGQGFGFHIFLFFSDIDQFED